MINKLKTYYYRNSIRKNLIITLSSLYIFATITFLFATDLYYRSSSLNSLKELHLTSLQSADTNFMNTINNTRNISSAIFSNTAVQKTLNLPPSGRSAADTVSLESALSTICMTTSLKLSAYIYDFSKNCYYMDSTRKKELLCSDITEAGFYPDLCRLDGDIMLFRTSDIYKSDAVKNSISVMRIIKDINTFQNLGVLIVNLPENDLKKIFYDLLNTDTSVCIFSSAQKPLFSSGSFTYPFTEQPIESSGNKEILVNKTAHVMSYETLDDYNLLCCSYTPLSALSPHGPNLYIVVILMFNLLLVTLGIFTMSRSLTTPINSLVRNMSKVKGKQFQTLNTPYCGKSEIGILTAEYNKMLDEIEQLLKKEVISEKNKRHLQLNLLQAQFKPHFLYNSIDTARALCLNGQTRDVDQLLKAIGTYYRNMLSKGKSIISVDDEIDTIKQYAIILQYKGAEWDFEYQVEQNTRKLPILKFILQPLVENSIKHGFAKCSEGTIKILTRYCNDTLYLSVSDDGIGMSGHVKDLITHADIKDFKNSYGLRATIEQMRLYYGDSFQYIIDSEPDEGTCISFIITGYHNFIDNDWGKEQI